MNCERLENVALQAEETLGEALLSFEGEPVGTRAALDTIQDEVNYDQCFTRDFFVSAVAFLLAGETKIVRSFLSTLVHLQSHDKHIDCFRPGAGLMPASFGVRMEDGQEALFADFGEHAIARVSPVDSGLWWLYLLCAYTRVSSDRSLVEHEEVQEAIRLVLELYLTTKFEMFPTLLVPDGAYTIDRRMGVYGHPIDVQALLHIALRAADELLATDDPLTERVAERRRHVAYHVRRYYWLDFRKLNAMYRYRVEQFGRDAVNLFNIQGGAIPQWIIEWLPQDAGFFAGNLGPARLDVRCFSMGNMLAILSGMASDAQADAFFALVEERWEDLVGSMPMKLVFPALTGRDWELLTGSDPKNKAWSYHNGGSWPSLLWLLAIAARVRGREELARRALVTAAERLGRDRWPEYYDGPRGRLIGRQARLRQTWSAAGWLAAYRILEKGADYTPFVFDVDAVSECDDERRRR